MAKVFLFSFFLFPLLVSNLDTELVGKSFPIITCETLTDVEKAIPHDCKGKFTLLAMAYSSDAENDLQSWLNPVYNKFIAKTGMFDSEYDINLYFIPMFTGTNIATANLFKKRMKEEMNKEIHPNVLFYKGNIDEYKKTLKMDKKDTPYIFLLDKEGKIIYNTFGVYSDDKMEAIEDLL